MSKLKNGRNVIVIGGGPGGLAAAMQLAHAGAKVTLLEAKSTLGGRCSLIEQDGFRFDLGPTFFLYPRVLKEIFQSVGRNLDEEVPMARLDPQYRITFGAGGKLDCTPNLEEMERQIVAISPKDAGALRRYMDENRTKLQKFRPILESPFNSALDLLRPPVLAAAPMAKPWKTLGQELNSYFKDPRLTIAFSFQSKYLGMSPFRCPSLFSILSFLEYEHGVFHPLGGCGQVSLAMGRVASELGVDIHLNEPVTELKFEGKRVTGVKTSRGDYELDALVINADFANTMKRLVPDRLRNRWTDRKLAAKQYSCSTFMLYLGIEGQYAKLPHHSIHIATDYEKNLREIELDHVLPEDPSFYVQNPSVTDPSLAPAGCSGLYILVPVPNLQRGTIDWDSKTTAAYRDKVLDRLQLIGIEGVRDRIKTEFQVTPKDWQEKYGVYYGATFNLAHSLSQMLHLRPHNRFEDLESVYLVGGGTHPGSGLPVIYESSRISCRQLLPKLGLSTQFMEVAP